MQIQVGPTTVPLSSIGTGNTFQDGNGVVGLVLDTSGIGFTVPSGNVAFVILASGATTYQAGQTGVFDVAYKAVPAA